MRDGCFQRLDRVYLCSALTDLRDCRVGKESPGGESIRYTVSFFLPSALRFSLEMGSCRSVRRALLLLSRLSPARLLMRSRAGSRGPFYANRVRITRERGNEIGTKRSRGRRRVGDRPESWTSSRGGSPLTANGCLIGKRPFHLHWRNFVL